MSLSTRSLLFVLAAALGVASGARAQEARPSEVYKIVGPDGKITFSDRVPTGTGVRASLVNAQAASQPIVMPPAITAIASWQALSQDARRGIVPAVPLGQNTSSPGVITLQLVDSLTAVLARAEIVQTLRDQCVRVHLGTGGVYDDVARRWQEHNASAIDRANVVLLAAFDPPRRAKLQANAHTRLLGILAPLGAASAQAKALWCEQSADAVSHGALDVEGPNGLAQPLKDFVIH